MATSMEVRLALLVLVLVNTVESLQFHYKYEKPLYAMRSSGEKVENQNDMQSEIDNMEDGIISISTVEVDQGDNSLESWEESTENVDDFDRWHFLDKDISKEKKRNSFKEDISDYKDISNPMENFFRSWEKNIAKRNDYGRWITLDEENMKERDEMGFEEDSNNYKAISNPMKYSFDSWEESMENNDDVDRWVFVDEEIMEGKKLSSLKKYISNQKDISMPMENYGRYVDSDENIAESIDANNSLEKVKEEKESLERSNYSPLYFDDLDKTLESSSVALQDRYYEIYSLEQISSSSYENKSPSEEIVEKVDEASQEDLEPLVKILEDMTQGNYVSHIKEKALEKSSELMGSSEEFEEVNFDKESYYDFDYDKNTTNQHQKHKRHILTEDFKYQRQYNLPLRLLETKKGKPESNSKLIQYDAFPDETKSKYNRINNNAQEESNSQEYDSGRPKANLLTYITEDLLKQNLVNHQFDNLYAILNPNKELSSATTSKGLDTDGRSNHLNDLNDDNQTSFNTSDLYTEHNLQSTEHISDDSNSRKGRKLWGLDDFESYSLPPKSKMEYTQQPHVNQNINKKENEHEDNTFIFQPMNLNYKDNFPTEHLKQETIYEPSGHQTFEESKNFEIDGLLDSNQAKQIIKQIFSINPDLNNISQENKLKDLDFIDNSQTKSETPPAYHEKDLLYDLQFPKDIDDPQTRYGRAFMDSGTEDNDLPSERKKVFSEKTDNTHVGSRKEDQNIVNEHDLQTGYLKYAEKYQPELSKQKELHDQIEDKMFDRTQNIDENMSFDKDRLEQLIEPLIYLKPNKKKIYQINQLENNEGKEKLKKLVLENDISYTDIIQDKEIEEMLNQLLYMNEIESSENQDFSEVNRSPYPPITIDSNSLLHLNHPLSQLFYINEDISREDTIVQNTNTQIKNLLNQVMNILEEKSNGSPEDISTFESNDISNTKLPSKKENAMLEKKSPDIRREEIERNKSENSDFLYETNISSKSEIVKSSSKYKKIKDQLKMILNYLEKERRQLKTNSNSEEVEFDDGKISNSLTNKKYQDDQEPQKMERKSRNLKWNIPFKYIPKKDINNDPNAYLGTLKESNNPIEAQSSSYLMRNENANLDENTQIYEKSANFTKKIPSDYKSFAKILKTIILDDEFVDKYRTLQNPVPSTHTINIFKEKELNKKKNRKGKSLDVFPYETSKGLFPAKIFPLDDSLKANIVNQIFASSNTRPLDDMPQNSKTKYENRIYMGKSSNQFVEGKQIIDPHIFIYEKSISQNYENTNKGSMAGKNCAHTGQLDDALKTGRLQSTDNIYINEHSNLNSIGQVPTDNDFAERNIFDNFYTYHEDIKPFNSLKNRKYTYNAKISDDLQDNPAFNYQKVDRNKVRYNMFNYNNNNNINNPIVTYHKPIDRNRVRYYGQNWNDVDVDIRPNHNFHNPVYEQKEYEQQELHFKPVKDFKTNPCRGKRSLGDIAFNCAYQNRNRNYLRNIDVDDKIFQKYNKMKDNNGINKGKKGRSLNWDNIKNVDSVNKNINLFMKTIGTQNDNLIEPKNYLDKLNYENLDTVDDSVEKVNTKNRLKAYYYPINELDSPTLANNNGEEIDGKQSVYAYEKNTDIISTTEQGGENYNVPVYAINKSDDEINGIENFNNIVDGRRGKYIENELITITVNGKSFESNGTDLNSIDKELNNLLLKVESNLTDDSNMNKSTKMGLQNQSYTLKTSINTNTTYTITDGDHSTSNTTTIVRNKTELIDPSIDIKTQLSTLDKQISNNHSTAKAGNSFKITDPLLDTKKKQAKLEKPISNNPSTTKINQTELTNQLIDNKAPHPKLSKDIPSNPLKCNYSTYASSHSMNLNQSEDCHIVRSDSIGEEEKSQILKKHNDIRAKLARGAEERGKSGPQLNGSNVRELRWNDELAKVAQAWSKQCARDHDCNDCRSICSRDYPVGQNIFTKKQKSPEYDWTEVIKAFYNEVDNLPRDCVASFSIAKNPEEPYGHYTQMVWAGTYEIGCAVSTSQDSAEVLVHLYVCNYGPAGNVEGEPVYLEGQPASDCSYGVSDTYLDLCS